MIMRCKTQQQFVAMCYEFIRLGTTFEADADTFIITFTGGY